MKVTLSEIKQIIKEEVDRYKKIKLLEAKKASVEKELEEFLKEIEEGEFEEGIGMSLTNKKGTNAKPSAPYFKSEEEMEEGVGLSLTNKKGMNVRPNTPIFNSEKDTDEGVEMSLTNKKGMNAKPNAPYFKPEEEMVDEANFLKRGLNSVGKALSIGDRATDANSYSNSSLGKLNSKNIKHVANYIQGKNTAVGAPTRENITRELKDIANDIKSILDKGKQNPSLKNAFDKINNIVSHPSSYIPNFIQGEKNQYGFILELLKELYDLTYNEGN